ncbi:MAG: aminoacyl-histidine dipeptidase [bacterium]|nr:aminoacyl-histidine dipeptidase [bacterium]
MNIHHPKTVEILEWFKELNKIPRCSKNENAIRQWLLDWAVEKRFEGLEDKIGNVLIRVPGSRGYEDSEPVIIQGHLDMVCEKTPDSNHDFSTDPIRCLVEGQWLTADKTTLGADNGIAIAIGMTAALDKDLKHPPLELLFTVDEETGLTGAFGLEAGFLEGERLLNIDSEEEGILTVGCAGGLVSEHQVTLDMEAVPEGFASFTLEAGGMAGGHSADIYFEKANALKVLGRVLNHLLLEVDCRLAHLEGGKADNAIPRNAEALIYLPGDKGTVQRAMEVVGSVESMVRLEYINSDPGLFISLEKSGDSSFKEVLTPKSAQKTSLLIQAIPHGVYAMSTEVEHFVEVSNNFASMRIEDNRFRFMTSQRSPMESRLDDVTAHITAVVKLAGGTTENFGRYPGWPTNIKSKLLEQSVTVYEKVFGEKPGVEVTHGGLECGVIGSKFPEIDMISFGPTIKEPHSPDEKIHIGSIGKVWDFMTALLEELK